MALETLLASSITSDLLVQGASALLRHQSKQELTAEFKRSSQGKKAKSTRFWCRIVALGCLTIAIFLVVASLSFLNWSAGTSVFAVSVPILLGSTALGIGYLYYKDALSHFEPPASLKTEQLDGKAAQAELDTNLPNLIHLNRRQVAVYHDITTGQARIAARNSQVAMSIGFIMLVAGAVFAVKADNNTSKLVVGALASIGSILSGYIGRTFLLAQQRAMEQLYRYWKQPLATSYLLTAERLAKGMSQKSVQDQMITNVIAQVLTVALLRDEDPPIDPLKFHLKRTRRKAMVSDSQAESPAQTSPAGSA